MVDTLNVELPGLDCGLCGYRTCDELRERLATSPEMLDRCIHLSKNRMKTTAPAEAPAKGETTKRREPRPAGKPVKLPVLAAAARRPWQDSLGREFDFYLEHFPEEPGPREIILPHNPLITREMEIRKGDILIGRPLGMSCGCPITHCGVATEVDLRTGVIVWCVTGPLGPRETRVQGPGLLHCRRLRGPGPRDPLRTESRHALLLSTTHVHAPVAA